MDDIPEDRGDIRDHLANERTLLAWIRTSIALIALGFVVAKFGLLLREIGGAQAPSLTARAGAVVGVFLVGIGCLSGVLATLRFRRLREQIARRSVTYSATLDLTMGALIVVVSITLAVYMIVTA
jgi:putative membrane protein